MQKKPLIIDCDPGVDDVLAVILAHTKSCFDIKAVTSVAGNVQLEYTTRNLQMLANLIALNCPIARGQDRPLIKKQISGAATHGKDGFGGYAYLLEPFALHSLDPLPAVSLMAKILRESEEKVSIAATGPLTNVAILLKAYPELFGKIDRISIMGGGLRYGNITSTAEFNFFTDPEAAQIVLNAGIPITLVSLDATLQAYITDDDLRAFAQIHNPIAEIATKVLASYAAKDAALHDPVAILALSNPEIMQTTERFIQVETNEGCTRGMCYEDHQ